MKTPRTFRPNILISNHILNFMSFALIDIFVLYGMRVCVCVNVCVNACVCECVCV